MFAHKYDALWGISAPSSKEIRLDISTPPGTSHLHELISCVFSLADNSPLWPSLLAELQILKEPITAADPAAMTPRYRPAEPFVCEKCGMIEERGMHGRGDGSRQRRGGPPPTRLCFKGRYRES